MEKTSVLLFLCPPGMYFLSGDMLDQVLFLLYSTFSYILNNLSGILCYSLASFLLVVALLPFPHYSLSFFFMPFSLLAVLPIPVPSVTLPLHSAFTFLSCFLIHLYLLTLHPSFSRPIIDTLTTPPRVYPPLVSLVSSPFPLWCSSAQFVDFYFPRGRFSTMKVHSAKNTGRCSVYKSTSTEHQQIPSFLTHISTPHTNITCSCGTYCGTYVSITQAFL